MKSLEHRPEYSLEPTTSSPSFPCLYVDGEQMPEINKWEVGEEYKITLKVKMRDYSSHTDIKGTHSHATLDAVAYDT